MGNSILTRLARQTTRGYWQGGWAVLGIGFLALLLSVACSLDENPYAIDRVEIDVVTVSSRVTLSDGTLEERRYLVDGFATDPEWGAAPSQHIAMNPGQGSGGGSFTVTMKTVQDSARIYFLLQWPDVTLNRWGPWLVFDSADPISGNCDPQLETCVWRLFEDDEDRAALMFDIDGDAGDARGSFTDLGCTIACHGNMHPSRGSLDLWHWRAGRTNPLEFPLFANRRVGFADDEHADASGRHPDAGVPFFRDNFEMIDCGDGTMRPLPLRVADALDAEGQPSTQDNERMRPCEYIADVIESQAIIYDECETRNPCRLFEQDDIVAWVAGDAIPATLLNRPENAAAREDRHDIEAKGRWIFGVWTLELSRLLRTGSPDDVQFEIGSGRVYSMSLAIMNNSGATHAGSPVLHLRFD